VPVRYIAFFAAGLLLLSGDITMTDITMRLPIASEEYATSIDATDNRTSIGKGS